MENIKNKKAVAAIIIRAMGFAFGICGIIWHILVNTVIENGFMVKHNLAYFTIQTNIFSTLIFGVLVVKTIRAYIKTGKLTIASINPSVHLACTFYITITMLGYWGALFPMMGLPKNIIIIMDTMLLHTITPIMAIVDCSLNLNHGLVKKSDAFKWLSYPVVYLISLIIISRLITEPYYTFKMHGESIGLMYPYPFMDPSVVGVSGMILIILILALLFYLFGLLVIIIDKKLFKAK